MAYSKQNFQNGQILNAANLETMENGIIAGQGAENLLDNSNFRDPVNSRGKNTYSNEGNEYTIDRWETQVATNISIENGYINIFGQWGLYQRIQNPKDGIYTFAARIRINSVGQFTPSIEVNNGSNTGRRIDLDADIGEWKTYILQYDLSSMTAETIRFLLSPRGGDTTASISVEWAAMYKGAYTAATLPAYVPKGKHVEMLNCGVSLQPHNLFDNSDFRNPVNSRGITSIEASGYHIDRWKKENESGKVTVGNGYLSMTGTGAYWFLTQYIEPKKIKSGAVYTIALADTSGSISICSTVMSTDMAKFTARHTFTSGAVVITNVEYASDKYSIYFTSNSSKETRFAWAALYEGAYTADTLPPYQPKGYAAELAECQRYYYQTWDGAKPSSGAKIPGIQIRNAIAASRLVNVEFPVAMRITPTITLYTSDFIEGAVRNWNNSSDTVTGVIAVYGSTKGFVPGKEASDFTNGAPYSFHYSASADL